MFIFMHLPLATFSKFVMLRNLFFFNFDNLFSAKDGTYTTATHSTKISNVRIVVNHILTKNNETHMDKKKLYQQKKKKKIGI